MLFGAENGALIEVDSSAHTLPVSCLAVLLLFLSLVWSFCPFSCFSLFCFRLRTMSLFVSAVFIGLVSVPNSPSIIAFLCPIYPVLQLIKSFVFSAAADGVMKVWQPKCLDQNTTVETLQPKEGYPSSSFPLCSCSCFLSSRSSCSSLSLSWLSSFFFVLCFRRTHNIHAGTRDALSLSAALTPCLHQLADEGGRRAQVVEEALLPPHG